MHMRRLVVSCCVFSLMCLHIPAANKVELSEMQQPNRERQNSHVVLGLYPTEKQLLSLLARSVAVTVSQ